MQKSKFEEFLLNENEYTFCDADNIYLKEKYNDNIFFILKPSLYKDNFTRFGIFSKERNAFYVLDYLYSNSLNYLKENHIIDNLEQSSQITYGIGLRKEIKNMCNLEIEMFIIKNEKSIVKYNDNDSDFPSKYNQNYAIKLYIEGKNNFIKFLDYINSNIEISITFIDAANYLTSPIEFTKNLSQNYVNSNVFKKHVKPYMLVEKYFRDLTSGCYDDCNDFTLRKKMYTSLEKNISSVKINTISIEFDDGHVEKTKLDDFKNKILDLDSSVSEIKRISFRNKVLWKVNEVQ